MGENFNQLGEFNDISDRIKKILNEKPRPYTQGELQSITSKIENKIGSGVFGDVYEGQLQCGRKVAVKVLKKEITVQNKNEVVDKKFMEKQFKSEVDTMGRAIHPNLVKLYGFCYDDNMKALVYEFVENKSFDKILYQKQSGIEWAKLYDICIKIGKGLSYLHESCYPKIIHHDIKSENVLLDKDHSPKITDFGLARLRTSDLNPVSQIGGTRSYAAPEVCYGWKEKINHKCDIYSFGLMLFEILIRKRIWIVEDFPEKVWKHLQDGKVSEIMIYCGIEEKDQAKAKRLSLVALLCVQHIHHKRPDMSKVVKMLEEEIEPWLPPLESFPYDNFGGSSSSSMSGSSCSLSFSLPSKLGPPKVNPAHVISAPNMKLAESRRRCPPGGENAVVVYIATRGRSGNIDVSEGVVSTLKSYQIQVDVRDASNKAYLNEMQTVVGKKSVYPPIIFVKGKQLDLQKMFKMAEEGTLGNMFEGIPRCGNDEV